MLVGLKEKKKEDEGVDEEQKMDEAEDLTIPATISEECADLIKLLTDVAG